MMIQGTSTTGTWLSSTIYVWYGKVSAKLYTSAGAGVVTSLHLLADSKDEIDFDFVNVSDTSVLCRHLTSHKACRIVSPFCQIHSLRFANCLDGKSVSYQGAIANTSNNVHEYTIDWTRDLITWSIDGEQIRTQDRESTWNATAGRYQYPQTPARIQLSIWPAGLSTNRQALIDWAGGEVDWNLGNLESGEYYAQVNSITIECYDSSSGSTGYVYSSKGLVDSNVNYTSNSTVLGTLHGTGTDLFGTSSSNHTVPVVPSTGQ